MYKYLNCRVYDSWLCISRTDMKSQRSSRYALVSYRFLQCFPQNLNRFTSDCIGKARKMRTQIKRY